MSDIIGALIAAAVGGVIGFFLAGPPGAGVLAIVAFIGSLFGSKTAAAAS